MPKLLYIKASPRGDRSHSLAAGRALVDAWREANPDGEVDELDVFEADMPPFDGPALDAKYAILGGGDKTPDQEKAWKEVETIIERFTSADRYVVASPMWNFGIPYRLKQYFDVLVQPGYVFSYSPDTGYTGLVTGKPVRFVLARGGSYENDSPFDLQRSYLEILFGFMGFEDMDCVLVEPTMMEGPDVAKEQRARAIEEATRMGKEL